MFEEKFKSSEIALSPVGYPEVWIDISRYKLNSQKIYLLIKRFMDLLCASIGLVLLSPLYFFIVAAIKVESRGKALYKHKRLGKDGNYIYLYKFRTMVSDAGNLDKYFSKAQLEEFYQNFKLNDDPRITKVGKILRKTSLDEFPQLFNILKGEMSLIGPRPVVDVEIDKYGLNRNRFLSVKPGLTGWWACNGRSATTYEDRIKLELYYVNNISFSLDTKCFFKTIVEVAKGNGAE